MGMFDFANIPWMNDRDPAAATAVSAASHNFNAARERAQQQGQFEARMPLWLQEQENRNLESASIVQSRGLDNQLKQRILTNTMEDQQTLASWLQQTGANPSSMLSATPPLMKTVEGQQQLTSLLHNTAATMAGNAVMQRQTDMFKSASQLINEGGPDAFTVDGNGQPTVNPKILADGWRQMGELKQRRAMELIQQRGDTAIDKEYAKGDINRDLIRERGTAAIEKEKVRGETARDVANIRGDYYLRGKTLAAYEAGERVLNEANLAAFRRKLDIIAKDRTLVGSDAKEKALDDVMREFGVSGVLTAPSTQSPSTNTSGQPAVQKNSPQADSIPRPTTQEEVDALPSGTVYMDPSGRKWKKK